MGNVGQKHSPRTGPTRGASGWLSTSAGSVANRFHSALSQRSRTIKHREHDAWISGRDGATTREAESPQARRESRVVPAVGGGVVREREHGLRGAAKRSKSALQVARLSMAKALAGPLDQDEAQWSVVQLEGGGPTTTAVAPEALSYGTSHTRIRATLAAWISERSVELAETAADIALGIHPWPDRELSDATHRELIDEMYPWLNARHPDAREIVADRLLRFAETLRHHDVDRDFIAEYEFAARRLAEAASASRPVADLELRAAMADPLGPGPTASDDAAVWGTTVEDVISAPAGSDEPEINVGIVVSAIEAACHSGSLDLGVNFGGEAVGTSIGLLIQASGYPSALSRFDQWLESSDGRTRELLLRRVFTLAEPLKLHEIGTSWGLTRERVRQLEVKARDSVERVFGPTLQTAGEAAAPMTKYVLPSERFARVSRLLGSSMRHAEAVAAAVVHAAGPWVEESGWTYHNDLATRLSTAKAAVLKSVDELGLLPDDAPSCLDGLFATEEDQLLFFRSSLGIVEMSGYWGARDSQRSRIAAALKRIGRPASKGEIAEAAGIDSESRISATLSGLPGVVRADKERWAFTAWVDDPYDGIAGEISQRIDANSGSVAVASILEELPRRFGVSESSVQAYLQTPAFVVEDGFASRAEPGAFEAAPPSKWSDAFRHDELWGQRLRVEQRHLDGYSMKVRFDIAFANGLRPGNDLRVPAVGTSSVASVIWRAHDASRAIDVGRISDALVTLGLEPGQYVVVCPSPQRVVFASGEDVLHQAGVQVSADDEDVDHHDPLFDLLGQE